MNNSASINHRNEKTAPLPVIKPEMLSQDTAPFSGLPANYRALTLAASPAQSAAPELPPEQILEADPVAVLQEKTAPHRALIRREVTAPFRALRSLIEPEAPKTNAVIPTLADIAPDLDNGQATRKMAVPVLAGRALEWGGGEIAKASEALVRPHYWARGEVILMLGLMLVGLVMQSINMFNYPALNRFDDEGIYMSQAWAVLRQGQLAPYTYFYDHAPSGWLLLAGWLGISGGPFTFGNALDSGRMFMLLLHLAMIPLLYQLARKFGCHPAIAAFATLLFSVSPLAIFYQRLVLLDNIMMFWLLLSLNLLLDGRGRLSRVGFSGLCFGVAILSKETAVFLLPALLFIVWQQRWKHQGGFGLLGWVLPMLSILSLYPLYALIKGELLPAGQSLAFFILNIDTPANQVSLLDALRWQAGRGGAGVFWKLTTDTWMQQDVVLFVGGAIASGLNLLRILKRNRQAFAVGLLGLLPLYYLARGGLVFDYYVIFAIPFLALNLALLINPITTRVPKLGTFGLVAVVIGTLLGSYAGNGNLLPLYTARPDIASREATTWIKQNIPAQSLMVIRNDMWTDLHEPGLGGPAFPNAHSHWKVALDPAIRDGVFHNDWHMVDYVVVSPQLKQDLVDTNATMVLDALKNATLVRRWDSAGNQIEIWKINNGKPTLNAPEALKMLSNATAYLNQHFGQGNGSYPDASGKVTSESQANAMLRAVWAGDQTEFNRVWQWTQTYLLDQNNLLVWQWKQNKIIDPNSTSAADTDAALALLLASKRWNDPQLLASGKAMVQAIWEREVVTVGETPYLTAGNWATQGSELIFNPSYFAPYAYRIFREVDPAHNWQGVIEAGYKLLFDASSAPLGLSKSAGLPPEWVALERASGKLVAAKFANNQQDTTRYAYDAAQTYWRIALDLKWSNDGRAKAYLQQAGFLKDEVARKGSVSAEYAHDGSLLQKNSSVVSTVGALAAMLTLDPAAASQLYENQLLGQFNRSKPGIYWDNPDDLSAQEWGWFGTALYADALPDLWQIKG